MSYVENQSRKVGLYPRPDPAPPFKQIYQSAFENVLPAFLGIAAYHPLYTLKTMIQEGVIKNMGQALHLFRTNPKIYYRGFDGSIWSVPPIAVKSYMSDQMIVQYKKHVMRDITAFEQIGFAGIASVAGGVIAAVSEQYISHKQLTGDAFAKTIRHMARTGIKGFGVTIGREFCFGLACFGLVPIAQAYAFQYFPHAKSSPATEFAVGLSCSIVGGVGGAVVSQPLDVLKTRIQTNPGMNYRKSFNSIAKEGKKAFLKGLTPRTAGFMIVISIITSMRQVSENLFGKK